MYTHREHGRLETVNKSIGKAFRCDCGEMERIARKKRVTNDEVLRRRNEGRRTITSNKRGLVSRVQGRSVGLSPARSVAVWFLWIVQLSLYKDYFKLNIRLAVKQN